MNASDAARRLVLNAKTLADVLGDDTSDAALRGVRALVHPDKFAGDDAAWRRLEELVHAARGLVAPSPIAFVPLELTTKGRTYRLTAKLAEGDASDVYASEYDGKPCVVKVAGSPADNDLLVAEATALSAVSPKGAEDKGLQRLLPRLLDTFELRSGGSRRRVNVVSRASDGCVALADVRAAYPQGLDYRDAAWMVRRLFGALGLAHSRGWLHLAALPEHVLVHPTEHGAHLVDWCYAVKAEQPGRAVVDKHRTWYPPEILAKRPLDPQADVYMAGMCFAYLLGASTRLRTDIDLEVRFTDAGPAVPREIQAFVRGMLIANPARRPADAWALHDQLGEVMAKLVGPPKFRVLAMPARTPTT